MGSEPGGKRLVGKLIHFGTLSLDFSGCVDLSGRQRSNLARLAKIWLTEATPLAQ